MKVIKIFAVTCLAVLAFVPAASAVYVIDGNVSDWGVNLSAPGAQNKPYLNTHLPSGGNNIDYVTEDNADLNDGTIFVGPGYSIGNQYDAEAMYMDNDSQYLYLAIVTGLSPFEASFPAGDVFFDTGIYQDPFSSLYDIKKYSFGIDVLTGKFYSVSSWQDAVYAQHASANPWKMGANKTFLGDVDFLYTTTSVNSHYVMEAKIPLSFLSLDAQNDHDVWSHWTMMCGNDPLNLHGDVNANAVPEPATVSLMLLGGAGLGLVGRKKAKA